MNEVKNVNIIPVRGNSKGLVAIASCEANGFYLGSIGVFTKLKKNRGKVERDEKNNLVFDGYRITYPTKPSGVDNLVIYYAIDNELDKNISEAICKATEKLFSHE